MRRPLLVLSCFAHWACFAPDGTDSAVSASTGLVDESSSDATTIAQTTSSTLTATQTSSGGTTREDDETSTGDPVSSESSAASTSTDTTESGGTESTGVADPCQLALESFTEDPGWTSHALPDGGNDYGWSGVTDNAGGGIGEVGGTFQRSSTESFYADAVGPLDATQCIAASGTLAVPRKDVDFNHNVRVGHFSVDADPFVGFVGFAVMENVVGVRVFVGAGGHYELAFEVPDPEVPRAWSYAYDPVAATMTLDLEGFGSVTHDLTAEEIATIADLDAFGFRNAPHEEPAVAPGLLELWIDDTSYTR